MSTFKTYLTENKIQFHEQGGWIVVTHEGKVDLRNLETLPQNVTFKNKGNVDLRNLRTLPENVTFRNRWDVNLRNLETLSENVRFENEWDVYLNTLKALPANVRFNNIGNVYLFQLKTLSENVKFENGGCVNLGSLHGQKVTYRNQKIKILHIDGLTMIQLFEKSLAEDLKLLKCKIFKGGEIEDWLECFVAQKGKYCAFGCTPKEAIKDVNFKFFQKKVHVDEIVSRIKKSKKVSFDDYHLLTSTPRLTCGEFKKRHGISEDFITLEKALELTKGEYGGEVFAKLLSD